MAMPAGNGTIFPNNNEQCSCYKFRIFAIFHSEPWFCHVLSLQLQLRFYVFLSLTFIKLHERTVLVLDFVDIFDNIYLLSVLVFLVHIHFQGDQKRTWFFRCCYYYF